MQTEHFNIGILHQANSCIPYTQELEISYLLVITTTMGHNSVQVVSHGQSQFTMNKLDNKLSTLREVVQENRVIVTEYFVLSLTKMIQI